jgi:hypothetical protein
MIALAILSLPSASHIVRRLAALARIIVMGIRH